MSRVRAAATLALAVLLLGGCGGAGSAGPDGSSGPTTDGGTSSTAGTTTTTSTGSATASETLPEVTSSVAGTAVAGNSGGVGPDQTESFSEAVRLDDGTCVGWAGPGTGTWTQGLTGGARITVLSARSGAVLGSGTLGRSQASDVDPNGNGQWTCSFPFSATIRGRVPATFRIKVGSLQVMTARRDPSRPGQFVASVSTGADPKAIGSCAEPLPQDPAVWSEVVGRYWSEGFGQLCSSGIGIAKVERSCRPRTLGSDRIVAVLSVTDPPTVYEDAGGLKITDVTGLGSPATVRVRVSNGQPCP